MHDPFMFSTLLFIVHDPTVYRFSLPTRCGSSLHPTSSSRPGNYIAFPVVLERLFFRTVSKWLPCGAQLPPCLTYSSRLVFPSFFFLFASHFCYSPFSHLLSTIHELVTKTKEQCDDFSLLPSPSLCFDPGPGLYLLDYGHGESKAHNVGVLSGWT